MVDIENGEQEMWNNDQILVHLVAFLNIDKSESHKDSEDNLLDVDIETRFFDEVGTFQNLVDQNTFVDLEIFGHETDCDGNAEVS